AHRPLEVHAHARAQPLVEGGARQRLAGQLADETLAVDLHRGETAAVHRDRAADTQPLEHVPSGDADRQHVPAPYRSLEAPGFFNDAGEHSSTPRPYPLPT